MHFKMGIICMVKEFTPQNIHDLEIWLKLLN